MSVVSISSSSPGGSRPRATPPSKPTSRRSLINRAESTPPPPPEPTSNPSASPSRKSWSRSTEVSSPTSPGVALEEQELDERTQLEQLVELEHTPSSSSSDSEDDSDTDPGVNQTTVDIIEHDDPNITSVDNTNTPNDQTNDDPNASSKTTKPKSKNKRKDRAPSPNLPPPPRPPPIMTVRLDITLGGPSNYEVNIMQLAKASGQRPPTPPPPPRYADTDSSSDDEPPPATQPAAAADAPPPKPKIKRSRKRRELDYDLEDPFIDDSDLVIDAPTHFGQTKQQGFYVSSGEVALVRDKTPQKEKPAAKAPKSNAANVNKPRGSNLTSLLLQATAHATAPSKAPNVTIPNLSIATGQATSEPSNEMNGPSRSPSANRPILDPLLTGGSPPVGLGTRESPIALLDDEDNKPPLLLNNHQYPPPSPSAHLQPAAKKIKMDDGEPAVTQALVGDNLEGASFITNGDTSMQDPHKSIVADLLATGDTSLMSVTSDHTAAAPSKKRKVAMDDLENFNPQTVSALVELKKAVGATPFTTKGKFPPSLKPLLTQTATIALHCGDYNEHFFNFLPFVFPYNRFTMMKLTSRLMYTEHQRYLAERQDQLLEELRVIGVQDFERAKEDYAKACVLWEEKQKKKIEASSNNMDVDTPSRAASPSAHNASGPNASAIHAGDVSDAGVANITASGKTREREEKPPQQKYRWTDEIKSRVWGLVYLSNESCRIQNQMVGWEPDKVASITEQGARKGLYARITCVFPEGWMTSQAISREVSNMKLKLKKEEEAAQKGGDAGSSHDE